MDGSAVSVSRGSLKVNDQLGQPCTSQPEDLLYRREMPLCVGFQFVFGDSGIFDIFHKFMEALIFSP